MEQLVWKANDRGEALSWNKRWYEYTGATQDASLGPGWFQFVHPDDLGALQDKWLNLPSSQVRLHATLVYCF